MNQPVSTQTYKNLICDMIQSIDDSRFIRQIYSIVYQQLKRRYMDNVPMV